MTQDQTHDIVSEIEETAETIEDMREDEKERHNEKMEEIEQSERNAMGNLYEKAGLDAIEAIHDDITDLRSEILSQRKTIKKYVGAVLNTLLPSGGYKETITLKDGWVYRYGQRKNSSLSLSTVTGLSGSGSYRGEGDALEELIDASLSDVDAQALKLALSRLDEAGIMHQGAWSRTVEPAVEEWDELKIRYNQKTFSRRSKTEYVKLEVEKERGWGTKKEIIAPDTRDADDMVLLVEHRDTIIEQMDAIHDQMADERDANEEMFAQVKHDVPVEVEEDYRL